MRPCVVTSGRSLVAHQAAANGRPSCPLAVPSVRSKRPPVAPPPRARTARSPGGEGDEQQPSRRADSQAHGEHNSGAVTLLRAPQDQQCSSSSSTPPLLQPAGGSTPRHQTAPPRSSATWPRRRVLLASSCAAVLLNACDAAAPAALWPHSAAHAALVDEDVAIRVYERAAPSVASIAIVRSSQGVQSTDGAGSGVVWSRGGHVVTNYHCVARLDKASQFLRVTLLMDDASDGNGSAVEATFSATVIGTDTIHDLAVLQLDDLQGPTTPIPVATSSDLRVGQSVYAIGNPYGLSRTLSVGLVSGLDRSIPSPAGARIYGVIQTDATINAGNSGGPLLDSSGRLVGLNTATFTRSGTGRGSGVNFALPADMLRDIVPKLIVYGNALGKRV